MKYEIHSDGNEENTLTNTEMIKAFLIIRLQLGFYLY